MKKALLIGIDYLENEKLRLFGCLNDIIAIGNMLIDVFDYDKENITMVRDDSRNKSKMPTKENILRELNKIVDNNQDDEIWIHFSGHGTYRIDNNRDEKDFYDEVIIPIDYRRSGVIRDEEMLDIIKKSKCKTVITYDCCNSGSICDLPWRYEFINNNFYKYKENNNRLDNPNIIMLTSCRDNQLAVDGYSDDNRINFGGLTQALLECLRFNHYNVKFFKLLKDISIYMKVNNREQVTTLSSSSEDPDMELKRPLLNRKRDDKYALYKDTNFRD